MYQPLVSIIIPVYNGSNYMREAIDSALAQTYKNIEVIVINDGSTDDGATDEVAKSYGNKIRYFEKENGGVSSALNFGIEKMSGEYFSWLSHDDVYDENKVMLQVDALNKHNAVVNTIVCCNYIHIDENSQPLVGHTCKSYFETNKMYNAAEVLTYLLTKQSFNGCCLLLPKRVFFDCGMFDETLRFCQDVFMWYQIFAKDYNLLYIDNMLVKNRVHKKQLTQTGQKLFKKECNAISSVLSKEFAKISTKQNNFLQMYLLSDARYFEFSKVKEIILLGEKYSLISKKAAITAYLMFIYGKIRPAIRKLYYLFFRNIKTT